MELRGGAWVATPSRPWSPPVRYVGGSTKGSFVLSGEVHPQVARESPPISRRGLRTASPVTTGSSWPSGRRTRVTAAGLAVWRVVTKVTPFRPLRVALESAVESPLCESLLALRVPSLREFVGPHMSTVPVGARENPVPCVVRDGGRGEMGQGLGREESDCSGVTNPRRYLGGTVFWRELVLSRVSEVRRCRRPKNV